MGKEIKTHPTAILLFLFVLCSCQGIVQREIEAPGLRFVWKDETPSDCPFERSTAFVGVLFTGKASDYYCGDTFYPSWADDGHLYSPYTDGTTDGMTPSSGSAERATTGNAVLMGDDPLNLVIRNTSEPQLASALPYMGRYPAGSLVHNGIWYYGTYTLGPSWGVPHEGMLWNWPVIGTMPGFRISTDYGKTWIPSPLTPEKPLFPEPDTLWGPVKMGAPHFVDFGKNMQYSPDGKAYLLGMGASGKDAGDRFANLSWITADEVYMARVTPSIENINNIEAYEFFAGHDTAGHPIWSKNFNDLKPLLDWNNHMGCVTATYNPVLKKFFMCVTDGKNTVSQMDSYFLEADSLTGPWRLITYMKNFGEQSYFLNIPSKFIDPKEGNLMWLCHSANFSNGWNGVELKIKPRGGRYGLSLHEMKFLTPSELAEEERNAQADPLLSADNIAPLAKVSVSSLFEGYSASSVVDGIVDGYPSSISSEWASQGEKEGASVTLVWDQPRKISRVWLFDRPVKTDQILSGKLLFDDGTEIMVDSLPDNAFKGREISFPHKKTQSLSFVVTKVKEGTQNIGLSEFAVFEK